MGKKLTTEEFIEKAKKVHGDRYDYSKVKYVNNYTKVKIICPKHESFWQTPNNHTRRHGCFDCMCDNKSKNTQQFIKEAKKLHGNKYDYSEVKYINCDTKVKIICPEHGVFAQVPASHLNQKSGCVKCKHDNSKLKINVFIKRAKKLHGNKYDYSKVKYINCDTKVKIVCPEHGVFEQTPTVHLKNCGCNICLQSHGEKKINEWLEYYKFKYKKEHTFPTCKCVQVLHFDFYLPKQKVLIEYDGIHHFKPLAIWGGKRVLNATKKRDSIKNKWAKENGYELLRIPYWKQKEISTILENNLL